MRAVGAEMPQSDLCFGRISMGSDVEARTWDPPWETDRHTPCPDIPVKEGCCGLHAADLYAASAVILSPRGTL